MNKLKSTKVQLVWFFTLASTIGLYMEVLDGGSYVALVTLLYTSFGVVNVAQKHLYKDSEDESRK